jgi:YVTN family beta-propeller protein
VALAAAAAATVPGGAAAADPESEAAFPQATHSSPIALSRDNRLVWVVNPGDDSVSVLRTDNNTVLMKIKVGDEPQSVALDPAGRFTVVANAAGGSLSVIAILNAKYGGFKAVVAGTVKTGAEPWNVVVSPDGKRVFVANSGQDTITAIDARRGVVIGHVNLRDSLCNDPDCERHFQPRGLAVSADNLRLYVTRFLSFTKPGGGHGLDDGEEGAVCRLSIDTGAAHIAAAISQPS